MNRRATAALMRRELSMLDAVMPDLTANEQLTLKRYTRDLRAILADIESGLLSPGVLTAAASYRPAPRSSSSVRRAAGRRRC